LTDMEAKRTRMGFTEAELALASWRKSQRQHEASTTNIARRRTLSPPQRRRSSSRDRKPRREDFSPTPPASPLLPLSDAWKGKDSSAWQERPLETSFEKNIKSEKRDKKKEKKKGKKEKKSKKSRRHEYERDCRHKSPSLECAPTWRIDNRSRRSQSIESTSTVDSFGREHTRRSSRDRSRSPTRDRSPSHRHRRSPRQRSPSPDYLSAAPPADPKRVDHDDRSWFSHIARSNVVQQIRQRSRSPSPLWNHEGYIQALKEPSPERMVPSDYVPPKPEWISRAGGVYIPNRSKEAADLRGEGT